MFTMHKMQKTNKAILMMCLAHVSNLSDCPKMYLIIAIFGCI